jgi:hypothetical protein
MILSERPNDDDSQDGFTKWPFMTTHTWAEYPRSVSLFLKIFKNLEGYMKAFGASVLINNTRIINSTVLYKVDMFIKGIFRKFFKTWFEKGSFIY